MIKLDRAFEVFCNRIGGNIEVYDKNFPTGLEKTYRCYADLNNSKLTLEITPSNGEIVIIDSEKGKRHSLHTRLIYDSTCDVEDGDNYVKFVCSSPEEPEDTIVVDVENNTLRRLKVYGETGTITYRMTQM